MDGSEQGVEFPAHLPATLTALNLSACDRKRTVFRDRLMQIYLRGWPEV
jgi:hypothetical protein